MSLCIGLIYQARTLVSTRHLLTTVSDLWAVQMLSAACKVGHVLICEACAAVRFCQRKDGLSYLVIRQLWIKPWHRAVTLTGGGELQGQPFQGEQVQGVCVQQILCFLFFLQWEAAQGDMLKQFLLQLHGYVQDVLHSHCLCVWVQGDQAAGNRPFERGDRERWHWTSTQAPVKLSLATGVIQVSAVSDESKTRNMFPQPRNYTGSTSKPINGYAIARSMGLSISLLAFAKISPCTTVF